MPKTGPPCRELRAVAERLASRMANHAYCEEHLEDRPESGCPSCQDRSVYAAWLAAGGQDYRWEPSGQAVSLMELRRTNEGARYSRRFPEGRRG